MTEKKTSAIPFDGMARYLAFGEAESPVPVAGNLGSCLMGSSAQESGWFDDSASSVNGGQRGPVSEFKA